MGSTDYVIAGAGIIGLSLALELERRGASVTVLEARRALGQTSFAAAGMLAVDDPLNPPELLPLARLSVSLYPEYLDRIAELSGERVPFQTSATLEAGASQGALAETHRLVPQLNVEGRHFHLLEEHSVDPRQLAMALRGAVRAVGSTKIRLFEESPLERVTMTADGVEVQTRSGTLRAAKVIDCMGSWSPAPVTPRKGQMLAVAMPAELDLSCVVRTPEVYLVPRTVGPHAGRLIIGATIESCGFDVTVKPAAILGLHARAVELLPILAEAKFVESWAGLRPSTVDGLPILGALRRQPRYVLATGHYRNGILLAPATARLMAELLAGENAPIEMERFGPDRFAEAAR